MTNTTDLKFFTNSSNDSLSSRLAKLMQDAQTFDVLVGYFYTSGFYLMHEHLVVNIKRHLEKFKCILSNRKENANGIDKQIAKGNYFFASVRRKLNFESNKIVSPQRAKKNIFSFNNIPWYASADVYFITNKDNKDLNEQIELKYVLALLNSKLYYHWFYHKGKRKGVMLELYQKPLSEVPIKIISKADQIPFVETVEQILAITSQPNYNHKLPPEKQLQLESQIDEMVCDLYRLNSEDKQLILTHNAIFTN